MYRNLNAEQARRGLSDKDMAARIGMNRRTYANKKTAGDFTVRQAKLVCKELGATFDYLFEEEEVSA